MKRLLILGAPFCAVLALSACLGAAPDIAPDPAADLPAASDPPEASDPPAASPVAADATQTSPVADVPPRRGLFRRRSRESDPTTVDPAMPGPDGATAAATDALRVLCGAEGRTSGKPTSTIAGFRLHDPAPESIMPRAVRLTGFADRCAREVTGAVVLFGQPVLYELTRSAQSDQSPGPTDLAYDALKARLCGGPEVCAALQDRAVFVTVHGRAGDDRRWMQMLLADGAMLASEVKTR